MVFGLVLCATPSYLCDLRDLPLDRFNNHVNNHGFD